MQANATGQTGRRWFRDSGGRLEKIPGNHCDDDDDDNDEDYNGGDDCDDDDDIDDDDDDHDDHDLTILPSTHDYDY